MCGIVGYVGDGQAAPVLLQGLEKLEYRGYDSAGVAVYDGTSLQVVKAKGRLKILNDMIDGGKSLPGDPRRAFRRQLPSSGERLRKICGGT